VFRFKVTKWTNTLSQFFLTTYFPNFIINEQHSLGSHEKQFLLFYISTLNLKLDTRLGKTTRRRNTMKFRLFVRSILLWSFVLFGLVACGGDGGDGEGSGETTTNVSANGL
jgi:hypothetical protein